MDALISQSPILILLAFVVITFLQSGIDKVLDWKGNLSWLTGHFAKTAFGGIVPFLLAVITIMELASGVLALAGIIEILLSGAYTFAFLGALGAATSLLFLLLGQRVAKDYEGARTIVVYLIPTVILLVLIAA
ncbi:DoxX family protein [Robiginitalea sediminis]|uniref:DoxX family protein n=1 Tax=Robiginitalea sediminis TaxID=1982593 RepID=UPI000B4BBD1A|nr:DoxX family protein [Robiginitalea sediminis]